MTFDRFYETATQRPPYPYQRRYALADAVPQVVVAPTGAGKTATVVLGWLFRRRYADPATRRATPRRLVLCLPMRTLVSQSASVATEWLRRLDCLETDTGLHRGTGVSVHVLLGGATDEDWRQHPEADAVIVGTQDMLLSRALNRGYGMGRYSWPWEYALLSNDCCWVFDEVQLMGVGLATGLQLAGLRERLGTYGPKASVFMSATLEPSWLETVDHPEPTLIHELSPEDLATPALTRRRTAVKRLVKARTPYGREIGAALASEIAERHVAGTRTIVVMNTVERATQLHASLRSSSLPTVLLHSRFRPAERERHLERAIDPAFEGVVVSTQVIEAGVDISCRTLVTDLAPWAALVQRAGRCNRAGEFDDAAVVWIDQPEPDHTTSLPYRAEELASSRDALARLQSINPEAIDAARVPLVRELPAHVLRLRDVRDLFDTTPDIAGVDLDVGRFIRDGDDRDCQVFWRRQTDSPDWQHEPRPQRDELCPVPFLAARSWAKKDRRLWKWDHLDRLWRAALEREILPGAVFLADSADGGYDIDKGWAPGSTAPVPPLVAAAAEPLQEDSDEDDALTEIGCWVTLQQHGRDTEGAAREILTAIESPDLPEEPIRRSARRHDRGKAHSVFQETMRRAIPPSDAEVWAKSAGRHTIRHSRTGFRHELASALAELAEPPRSDQDLVAYLVAAHHGKVRLSIRALPTERPPKGPDGRPDPERLYARGIWDRDELQECALGDEVAPAVILSLAPMQLGGGSWAGRVLALLDRFGPFRLAYLEMLVRAADVRASRREEEGCR